jgi:hypothetical protein
MSVEQQQKDQKPENPIQSYRIQTKSGWLPWGKIHHCRHEVNTETNHLILYRKDNTQIAMPVANKSWIVYPEYWQFMSQYAKLPEVSE